MNKKQILFIGSFKNVINDGGTGGQLFACNSLVNSPLSQNIDWILLDTTMESIPPPPLFKRAWKAAIRMKTFIGILLFKPQVKTILIFCANGWSFREKGIMLLLGKLFYKKSIISPRSGMILKDIERPLFRKFVSWVFQRSDIILCQSPKWKTVFSSLMPPHFSKKTNGEEHFIVCQNWIDAAPYLSNRPIYATENNKIVFLYLGSLELYKGIGDLIEAVEMVKDHLPSNAHFQVAGNGSKMTEMKKLVKKSGIDHLVSFLGWANYQMKMELLRTVDVFILPSHFEGFPNALIEAMASGLPCIATRVGAVEDVIEDGINGLLIDHQHPDQLAEVIIKISTNKDIRIKLGANARDTILANNSIDSVIETFSRILE